MSRRAVALAAGTLLVLVGGAEAALPTRHPAPPPAAVDVPVQSAALVCPEVRRGAGVTNRLGIAVPAATGSGSVGVYSADPANPLRGVALQRPGSLALASPRGVDAYPIVTATGTLAAGVVADTVLRVDDGFNRGLFGGACQPVGTQAWFAGASTTPGRSAVLTLTNVDALPAVVDVTVGGASGPIAAPGLQGLIVPPGMTVQQALQQAAPGEAALLVHTRARAGRVAAQLFQHVSYGIRPGGADFLPEVPAPSPRAVVPGLPAGTGLRRVVVGNPGSEPLSARVRLVTPDGGFVPTGLDRVQVAPGAAVSLDVTAVLRGAAAAVEVTGDRPLVAGATADTGPRTNGLGEFAWTAAVDPLSTVTAVPVTSLGAARSTLYLSAVDGAARVRLRFLDTAGHEPLPPMDVDVAQDHTRVLDLPPPPHDSPYGVLLDPVGGPGAVYAARQLLEFGGRGPLYTIEPVRSGTATARLRPATADPRVGAPH